MAKKESAVAGEEELEASDSSQSQAMESPEVDEVTASEPKRHFVDGRWITAEELAQEHEELKQRLHEENSRRENAVTQQNAQREPAWVQPLRENGVGEDEIRQLMAEDDERIDSKVRTTLHDELGQLTRQASEQQTKMSKALSKYKEAQPSFSSDEMNKFLSDDLEVKEGFDALVSQGKHTQAIDFAWSKRLLAGGPNKVNERGRNQSRVPATPQGVRQQREEEQALSGGSSGSKNVPQDVLDRVAYNAGEAEIRDYMQHRRKGTALDLDAPAPSNWNPSRR